MVVLLTALVVLGVIVGQALDRAAAGTPIGSPAGVAVGSPREGSLRPAVPDMPESDATLAATPSQAVAAVSAVIPTGSPSAGPVTLAPAPAKPIIHVVVRGETLIRIASRYGIAVDDIVAANDIEDPSLILPGQRLLIP